MRYRDSLDWLLPRVAGRRVLYVGTIDDDPDNARKHPAIHRALAGEAKAITGIYRGEEQAAELRAAGLPAESGTVGDLDPGLRFEVIVAADTLEHVDNAGWFLMTLERHLEQGGTLLVTTPNPASFGRVAELLFLGRMKANRAHTCWYTGQVLDQLAARVGLRVVESEPIDEMHKYHGGAARRGRSLSRRVASACLVGLNRLACLGWPQLSETYGFALVRSPGTTT
jgi:hypothetical protein